MENEQVKKIYEKSTSEIQKFKPFQWYWDKPQIGTDCEDLWS